MENEKITHDSFGMVEWRRVTGRVNDLFATSIEHDNFVVITIHKAAINRDLNKDWIFSREIVTEIELSPIQFSEFITSPNIGNGVPCTLRITQEKGIIKGLPIDSKRKQFEQEFEQECLNVGSNFKELNTTIENMDITKKKKEELQGKLYSISRIITDYMPFLQKSFNEQVDNTVIEAKHTIEAYVENKIRQVGIENISIPKLLSSEKED
jgi:hypothetical protein